MNTPSSAVLDEGTEVTAADLDTAVSAETPFAELDRNTQNALIAEKMQLAVAKVQDMRFVYNQHMKHDILLDSLDQATDEMQTWKAYSDCRWPDNDDLDD